MSQVLLKRVQIDSNATLLQSQNAQPEYRHTPLYILPSNLASALFNSLSLLAFILSSLASRSASKSLGTVNGSCNSNSFNPPFGGAPLAPADEGAATLAAEEGEGEGSRNDLRMEPKKPPTPLARPEGEGVVVEEDEGGG